MRIDAPFGDAAPSIRFNAFERASVARVGRILASLRELADEHDPGWESSSVGVDVALAAQVCAELAEEGGVTLG